ncbi:alpha/beta fold hydrolase [Isoptericola cucumis]|uniref:Alpha/beta hydrolase n=1 Tax=Isoptericola cucumis TaxID=1776856 RepID=A0ABQ2B4R6_9MICO|nr:alpha/beta hydrolase [Isoptericola cucumis]GGI07639.1 alpha/beta hydrolase [Isoptericola cucumis]
MTTTRYATHDDVTLAYETFGDLETGEPLLLIMGLDFQMVWWPDELCAQLVDAGFAVVRFDNRDTGLSTHLESPTTQNPWRALLGGTAPAYTGTDVLDDVEAVLDAVGWASAHVMGISLGAGVAQATALLRPSRVRTLTSCNGLPCTVSPLRRLAYLRFGVFRELARLGDPTTREEAIDVLVAIWRALSSPAHPFPEQWARQAATLSHDRSPRDPRTTQRQLAAWSRVRLPALSTVRAPTLVIAGEDDPLMKVTGGRDTARQIPGAQLRILSGMGHTLPEHRWPEVVASLRELAGHARSTTS